MSDRYMVIHPDTLEAMRRAGHVAKLEARIEQLEAALRAVIDWDNTIVVEDEPFDGPFLGDVMNIVRKALEGKDD